MTIFSTCINTVFKEAMSINGRGVLLMFDYQTLNGMKPDEINNGDTRDGINLNDGSVSE